MDDQILDRRVVLRGAGLAGASALGGVALAAPATADDNGRTHGVLGGWLITHRDDPPGDPTPVKGVITFAAGGAFANQDIDPISPTGMGTWAMNGKNGFRVNFWSGSPAGGPDDHPFTVNVRVRGTVRGDRIAGTFRFRAFDATTDDREPVFEGTGKFRGRRIEA